MKPTIRLYRFSVIVTAQARYKIHGEKVRATKTYGNVGAEVTYAETDFFLATIGSNRIYPVNDGIIGETAKRLFLY